MVQVSVFIHDSLVTGSEPAVYKILPVCGRIIFIPGRDVFPLDHYLTDRTCPEQVTGVVPLSPPPGPAAIPTVPGFPGSGG